MTRRKMCVLKLVLILGCLCLYGVFHWNETMAQTGPQTGMQTTTQTVTPEIPGGAFETDPYHTTAEVTPNGSPARPLFGKSNESAESTENTGKNDENKSRFTFSVGVQKLIFAVVAVTLLFMILIFILKKFTPGEAPNLPKDVFEILGKSQLAYRQQLYVMRCGQKLFVVSISQNGLDRVGEIEDPLEVERLTRRCHGEVLGTGNFSDEFRSETIKNSDVREDSAREETSGSAGTHRN